MEALALQVREGESKLGSIPVPTPSRDQVLIKVAYCGICGSDIHGLESGLFEEGHVPGHEFSGVVETVGEDVQDLQPGDRVTVDPLLNCGECESCLQGHPQRCQYLDTLGITSQGAMAEYVAVRASNVYKLPEQVSLLEGAMAEPLSVAIHAVAQSRLPLEERPPRVLVWGGGTIGLLLLQVLKLHTDQVALVEPVAEKRELARKWTPYLYTPENFWDVEEDLGTPHYIFEAVGKSELIQDSLDLISKGGKIVVVGLHTEPAEVDLLRVMYNEIEIIGTYANRRDFPRALDYMAEGKVDMESLVSAIYPLEKGEEAFQKAAHDRKVIKTMLEIQGG